MQNRRAWRTGHPDMIIDLSDGREIKLGLRSRRKIALGLLPGKPAIGSRHCESAVAHEPSGSRAGHHQVADVPQADRWCSGCFESTLPDGRDLASRISARMNLGLTGDAIDLEINQEGQLVQLPNSDRQRTGRRCQYRRDQRLHRVGQPLTACHSWLAAH